MCARGAQVYLFERQLISEPFKKCFLVANVFPVSFSCAKDVLMELSFIGKCKAGTMFERGRSKGHRRLYLRKRRKPARKGQSTPPIAPAHPCLSASKFLEANRIDTPLGQFPRRNSPLHEITGQQLVAVQPLPHSLRRPRNRFYRVIERTRDFNCRNS